MLESAVKPVGTFACATAWNTAAPFQDVHGLLQRPVLTAAALDHRRLNHACRLGWHDVVVGLPMQNPISIFRAQTVEGLLPMFSVLPERIGPFE